MALVGSLKPNTITMPAGFHGSKSSRQRPSSIIICKKPNDPPTSKPRRGPQINSSSKLRVTERIGINTMKNAIALHGFVVKDQDKKMISNVDNMMMMKADDEVTDH